MSLYGFVGRFRHRTQDKRRHSINSKFSVEIGAIEEVYLLRIIDEHANDIVQQSGSLERLDKGESLYLPLPLIIRIGILKVENSNRSFHIVTNVK